MFTLTVPVWYQTWVTNCVHVYIIVEYTHIHTHTDVHEVICYALSGMLWNFTNKACVKIGVL